MKQINIREALLDLDRKTDARYDLTTLYEACKLDDDDKQQLVKYIDAYDHPATINKFLSSKCDAITEALGDDDVSDMKLIDEINDGGDRTLWSLMNKFDDEDLQLKDLTEDVDPEVLQGRLDSIDYAMNHYVKDSFLIDDVQGSGKEWKVTYNDVTVDVTFDTDWEEYTYYINGKGPYAHSSYEYIASDIANFVDYNHLGQSDDEVDEALGDNRDVHSRTHMDSYDIYCTDCGQVTSHKFKGNFKDGEKELGRYICKECGCENDDDPINESLTEDVDTSNLEPQIKEVVTAVMQENGYESDEIEAYTAVEIKDTVDDMIQVEVRAELGYDDLMELCDKLNPIVAAVDHRAYFEPVTSGIARAFIRNDQSQDIVDEEAVNQWTNKIYDCASMEDLRQVWTAFKDHIDNGQYTDGTVDAVLDEIHKKADMLNESLTEATVDINKDYQLQTPATDYSVYEPSFDVSELEVGKRIKTADSDNPVTITKVYSHPQYNTYGDVQGISVSNGEYNYDIWFDNETLRDRGLVGYKLKNIILLDESLTEDTSEWFVGDSETGHMYKGKDAAQKAYDELVKSGVKDAVMKPAEDASLTEGYNQGDWVEVNLNTKKNGTPNIIPVKVDSGHGKTFLGWAWGERQHEYPMSAIVKKIDMDDTDAIIRKYTPSGYMSEKLTLNESDDTDILYDMEDYDEDNTTVTAGNSFIEDGHTWTWFKQCGDTVHLDFDNWAVWWAYRREDEDDEDSAAISGFFVVDTDTGFIDWGPCDTVKEAQEFLQSKVNDWENDDLDESKSIKEDGLDDFGVSKSNADMLSTRLPDSKFYINDNKYVFGRDLVDYFDEDEIISYSQYINADNIRVPNSYRINGRTRTATESIKEDINSAANSLFDLLKDYGAISVDKDVDVTRISFRNSEDDSDATLVHHCILSKGYKELTQYGNNPNVTEYINEAGDICVKLLIYDNSIAVELSAEDTSQYMNVDESVDKDLTHCTECGKKLNDKGYCETEGCPNGTLKEGIDPDFSDDELASIYGGDTKNDIPDGVETPEETEARLAKDNALKEGYSWIKAGDRFVIDDEGQEPYIVVTTYDKEDEKDLDKYERYIQVAREDNNGNFTDYQDMEYNYLAALKNKGKLNFI